MTHSIVKDNGVFHTDIQAWKIFESLLVSYISQSNFPYFQHSPTSSLPLTLPKSPTTTVPSLINITTSSTLANRTITPSITSISISPRPTYTPSRTRRITRRRYRPITSIPTLRKHRTIHPLRDSKIITQHIRHGLITNSRILSSCGMSEVICCFS